MLVVAPTLTWLAYNRFDMTRSGQADSWYTRSTKTPGTHVAIEAPLVTGHGGRSTESDEEYWMPFFEWLSRAPADVSALGVQVATDLELEMLTSTELARYSAIIFPGHSEYYTRAMYDRILQYRDSGGDLAFFSANSFYRRVVVDRLNNVMRSDWPYASACACNRDSSYSDYTISGSGFLGYDYEQRRPLVFSSGIGSSWVGTNLGLRAGQSAGDYTAEFDGIPPTTHPSAALYSPLWHDFADTTVAAGGVMLHPSGARTFSSANMHFAKMLMELESESTAVTDIASRVLIGMASTPTGVAAAECVKASAATRNVSTLSPSARACGHAIRWRPPARRS